VSLPSAAPALIRTGISTRDGVILTGVGFTLQANVQYMQTLNDRVYVYSYGDAPGQAVITGLATTRVCDGDVEGGGAGFRSVVDWYRSRTVANQSRKTTIIVASVAISGFVDRMSSRFASPESGLVGFDIFMTVID
jgi:hypothetical protein